MENRYDRNKHIAKGMQETLEALGFKVPAKEGHRAVIFSNLVYPEGTDDLKFRGLLQRKE